MPQSHDHSQPPSALEELDQAYRAISGGGLILAKLDIGYGFVGRSEGSIRRMYELKGRPQSNPCVVPGDIEILRALCPAVPPEILDWIAAQTVWTTISVIGDLDESSALWLSLPEYVRHQSSHDGSVAVFLKPGEFLEALVERAFAKGHLLVGSSGNLSGKGNSYRPEKLAPSIVDGVDLFIDHGVARYENALRLATTMVDLRSLEITRKGVNFDPITRELAKLRAQLDGGKNES